MTEEKLTYKDVMEYKSLFTMAPSFILSAMVRRNTNLVVKFKSQVTSYLIKLTPDQKKKLLLILNSDIDYLQQLMKIAYSRTKKSQFKILANPKNKEFIKMNLSELKKLV